MNPSYHPDGLTEAMIDDLIEEVFAEVKPRTQPIHLQADDVAAARRVRRLKNRASRELLRSTPLITEAASFDGEAA
jgi:hypothetical protein